MIRKLRKKLIAVSMVSLCIVLFCIFGFVGILNYQKMVSDADHTLSILADNDGTFPEPKDDEPDHAGKAPDAKDSSQPEYNRIFIGIKNTTYSTITPKRLAIPICAVCFTRGIIRIANGTNIPLTIYRYAKL